MNKLAIYKTRILITVIVLVLILIPFAWQMGTAKAATGTTTINPQRDKFTDVTGGYDYWQTPNGDRYLYVGQLNSAGFGTNQSVLGFDISNAGTVVSAKLKINVGYATGSAALNIYGSNTDSWSATDTNVPAKDTTILTNQAIADHNTNDTETYTYDVTNFVKAQSDGYATFVLSPADTSKDNEMYFNDSSVSAKGASLEITYTMPSATLSSGSSLNETNVNGSTVNLALDATSFKDSTLDANHFMLTGSTTGLSVTSVSYIDSTHCSITLVQNGTDFDNDLSFGVTIFGSELKSNDDLTSNTIDVTANNDAESISMSSDGSISEGAENGEVVTVSLTGGQFADTINPDNWTLGNLPGGVTKGTVTRKDSHTVEIRLLGNATADYDSNITNMSVTCTKDEYQDSSGGGSLTCNTGVVFTAVNDPESFSIHDDGSIAEGAEDGEIITATLSGGQFADPITPENWTVTGLPSGVTVGDVARIDKNTVEIQLSGNATADYDTDITNVGISCTTAEYTDSTGGGDLSCNTGVHFTANNDAESISVPADTTIDEGSENGKTIDVTLSGGQFASSLNAAHWSLSGQPSGVSIGSVTRTDSTHAQITLLGNATKDYDSDITGISVSCTAAEYTDNTGGGTLTSNSDKICFKANDDAESISLSDSGITEGAEDGETITATIAGGTFADTVTPANWTVSGLPAGVSKGDVTRKNDTTVEIKLSGNATADYDADITNVGVSCTAAEYCDNTGGGALLCDTGVMLKAVNDAETLSLSDDGTIAEGAEDGEIITATLSGGQFANIITPANWTLTGLPAGVSKGDVTRKDKNTVEIKLSGNATADYDTDITDVGVSCTASEYTDNTGGGVLSCNTGVRLTANNDAEAIAIPADTVIDEGSENGKTIDVTLSGGQFAASLNAAHWSLSGQPSGVSIGSVTRTDSTHARITLSGNADKDYDSDITGASVSCTAVEYTDNTGGGNLTSNTDKICFKADNDAESLKISDNGDITEGNEDGKTITATIEGGTFADTVTPANWTVTGLPAGVAKGTVTRIGSHTVRVALSGNATYDYDSDITGVTVTCAKDEYSDNAGGGGLTANTGVVLKAVNDAETLSISDDGDITEGKEDGEVITAKISGGQFADTVTPANWTVTGLPAGISKGTVTRKDNTTVEIKLSGNATVDYDADITDVGVSCDASEYRDNTGGGPLSCNRGVCLTAINDPETLTLSDDGAINEGHEDGEVITVTLSGALFADPVDPANWTLEGLPAGVSKGAVTRKNGHTVEITLSGNATKEYDTDITGLRVTCAAAEYGGGYGNGPISADSGVRFIAVNDKEKLSISDDGSIKEGAENGEIITATITGGQFADTINPEHWTLTGCPSGVQKGTVVRVDKNTVEITLQGNADCDYDKDITDMTVTCAADQYVDSSGESLCSGTGVTFTAVDDAETLTVTDSGIHEGSENGETITAKIKNGLFKNTLNAANWAVTNLPESVTIGSVARVDANTVCITLSGNAKWDYDADIKSSVSCTADEYTDSTGSAGLTASGAVFIANDDPESLSMSDNGIKEGEENGRTITVNLSGGQFAEIIDPTQWKVEHLPTGVSKGSVKRVDAKTVKIVLSGDATEDYDEDITDVKVTCKAGQYVSGSEALSVSNGVVLQAVVEPVKDDSGDNNDSGDDSNNSTTPEPSPSPSPSPSQSASAAPSASPEPSPSQPTKNGSKSSGTDSDNEGGLQATSIQENVKDGTIVLELDAASLPQGTTAIETPDGTIIPVKIVNGKIKLEIKPNALNKEGKLVFTAINDQKVPLGSFDVKVKDENGKLMQVSGSSFWAGFLVVALWVLGGLVILGLISVIIYSRVKKKSIEG